MHINTASTALFSGWGRRMGGAGRSHFLLAVVILSLTTHLFRGVASTLLLIKTLPTCGRSSHAFSMYYTETFCCLSYPPCCFADCGHHVSPRIVIVFSRLSSVPNFSMPHLSIFLIPSCNTSRSSLYFSHSPTE